MKIKNVVVGGYIQSKKDSKQLIAGHCYQVADKDISDKTVKLVSIDNSFDDSLWFCVSDFRKPRPQPQPEPKLKQLDQSIFNGLDEKWVAASVEENGTARIYMSDENNPYDCEYHLAGTKYDASNWQNSLIERDIAKELLEVDLSSELTGSDLTRSILSKQFMQACLVSDSSDKAARQGDDLQLIRMYNETNGKFISMRDPWHGCHHKYAVAVDNNRKPLTAADLGL